MIPNPPVVLRDGPAGRRGRLVGGPDVWEVVRAVRSARTAEPDLSPDEIVTLVSETSGVPEHLVRAAVDCRADYPDDVDAWVARADDESRAAEKRRRRAPGPLMPPDRRVESYRYPSGWRRTSGVRRDR